MSSLSSTSTQAYQTDAEMFLEEHDAYIRMQARRQVHKTQSALSADVLEWEIDDLAQKTRIRLWQAWSKQNITNPKAYIKRIVHNENISCLRRCKKVLPLPLDEDGELNHYDRALCDSMCSQDPQRQFEQEEIIRHYIDQTADAVVTLPRTQQHAILCSLKDRVDDLLPWIWTLQQRGLDISSAHWPTESEELQVMRSSASIARKKLSMRIHLPPALS